MKQTRKWKPGDVAMALPQRSFEPEFMVVRTKGGAGDYWSAPQGWPQGDNGADFCEYRPLVVIDLSEQPVPADPAARTEARHLIDMLREAAEDFFVPSAAALARKVADQIEEQVGPRTPKPDEPQGLGAVVEDVRGVQFVRVERGNGCRNPWSSALHPATVNVESLAYDDITAVKVLSEGVAA